VGEPAPARATDVTLTAGQLEEPEPFGFEQPKAGRISSIMRFGLPLSLVGGTGISKYRLDDTGLICGGKPNQLGGVGGYSVGTTRPLGNQDAYIEIKIVAITSSVQKDRPELLFGSIGVISDLADRDVQLGIANDSAALLTNGSFYKDGSLKTTSLCHAVKDGTVMRIEWNGAKKTVTWYCDKTKAYTLSLDARGWTFGVGGVYDWHTYEIINFDVPPLSDTEQEEWSERVKKNLSPLPCVIS